MTNLKEALPTYLKVGILSFGGPAAQIAMMHKVFVEEKAWIEEKEYLSALSFCMLLPGPEAMQLATYVGWRHHGVSGAIMAGLSFVLPGALVMFALTLLYAYFSGVEWVNAAFWGIKSAVLIIVIEALLKVSKRALTTAMHWVIAGLSFMGIFFFDLPFILVVLAALAVGWFSNQGDAGSDVPLPKGAVWESLQTALLWLSIWLVPLILIGFATDWGFLFELGAFFSKLATVTFGGAYAVLAFMSQEVAFDLEWVTATQMMDGFGMAETTPGPLILVTQFVGFMAGHNLAGLGMAILATMIVLWMTFVPCFLWILVGAPYVEWICAQPKLKSALSGITAAVVGVILSLSIWFGLHVVFGKVTRESIGVLHLWQPEWGTANVSVLGIAGICYVLLVMRKMNMIAVLGICAALGVIAHQIM